MIEWRWFDHCHQNTDQGPELTAINHLPIVQGLGNMGAFDGFAVGKIGNRARNAQDTVISAGRKLHLTGGILKQTTPVLIKRCRLLQNVAIGQCVG